MRRGQISLFIIAGIVVLLVIGLAVIAWNIINQQKPPEEQLKKSIPTELEPLNTLMESCLQQTTYNVLSKIGEHAGYYDPEAVGYVAIPDRPTEARAFEPFQGIVLPYWSYMSSPNTCTDCSFGSEQPPLDGPVFPAIQAQAEAALEQQLPSCLNGFSTLANRYTVTTQGLPVVDLSFNNLNTIVHLNYPLRVQTENKSATTLNDFTASVDIPFRRMYDYAYMIRNTTDRQHFFEGLTMESVALASIGQNNPIPPPYGGTQLTLDSPQVWVLPEVTRIVQNQLEHDVNIVQLFGSTGMDFVYTNNATLDASYANYYLAINDPAPNVTASFTYLSSWPAYMKVHPGGQVIRPDSMSMGIPFMPKLERDDFQYDASYPILIQLRSDTKEGQFLFQFPIEANMRNNQPLDFTPIDAPQPSVSYCDPSLANGADTNITITDQDGLPVDASISYSCLSNVCEYGLSRGGFMAEKLPMCIGGTLEADRLGFKTAAASFDSTSGSANVNLILQKITTVNVSNAVYTIDRSVDLSNPMQPVNTWSLSQNTMPIDVPWQMTVILEPKDDPTMTQVVKFPDGPTTADLYPGTYDITAVITQKLDQPYKIPSEEKCSGVWPFRQCNTIPEMWLGNSTYTDENGTTYDTGGIVYVGGLKWDETTKNITITQEMLDRGTITIPSSIVRLTSILSVEDLDVLNKIDEYSAQLDLQ